jgi:hypothetical protein
MSDVFMYMRGFQTDKNISKEEAKKYLLDSPYVSQMLYDEETGISLNMYVNIKKGTIEYRVICENTIFYYITGIIEDAIDQYFECVEGEKNGSYSN